MTEEVLHAVYAMISLFNRKYMVARPLKFLTFGLPCFRHPFDNLAFLVLCQPREPGALLSSTMSANDYECSCFSLGRSQEVDLIVGIAKHNSIMQRQIWRILNPRQWVGRQDVLDFGASECDYLSVTEAMGIFLARRRPSHRSPLPPRYTCSGNAVASQPGLRSLWILYVSPANWRTCCTTSKSLCRILAVSSRNT